MNRATIISFFVFIVSVTALVTSETCKTPSGDQGSCVNITECAPYMKILQDFMVSPSDINFLISVGCGFVGFMPKVCCVHTENTVVEQ